MIVRDFFEPQLRRIGLAADQIAEQDLAQLEASREKINDAIANPGAFGTLRVAFTAQAGVVIVQSNSEVHIEVGILPLLLERKDQILDRIRTLRSEQQLSELREDIASAVDDPQARDRLIEIVDRRSEEQRAVREDLDREQAQVEAARADLQERQMYYRPIFGIASSLYITPSSNASPLPASSERCCCSHSPPH